MANTFQFTDWLTMEGLRILVNKLQVAQFFNTDYNKEFTKDYAVGDNVRVPLPQRFRVREGLGYNPQAIDRIHTDVTVNQIFGIDFEWDSAEQALKLERGQEAIKKNYLDPAMAQLAQEIDSRCALWAKNNANNVVGVLGTNPSAFQSYSNLAKQRLIELACPPREYGAVVPPAVQTSLTHAGIQYFNPTSEISKQYKEGAIGKQGGFDWYTSMSLYRHTAGTWQTPAAVTVKGSGQSGSTLLVNATTGDTFKKGDTFSILDVNAVNPSTRRSTGAAKEFVVLEDVTAANSEATLSISPSIFGPTSQYQNVDALPISTRVLTLWPGTPSPNGKTGTIGLAIDKDAFALVGVKLETPKAVEVASQTRDPETGISVRFVRMFDPQQSKMINRFDVLIGFGNLYSDNCVVKLASA